jgi:hypothetical protein
VSEETYSVDAECIRETDKALLCLIDGEEVWVPKSQIHDDSEVYSLENGDGMLIVTMWWAEQKGLV